MGQLEANGFEIVQGKEETPVTRFMDIGAVVFFLKAVSWQVPDRSQTRLAHCSSIIFKELKVRID